MKKNSHKMWISKSQGNKWAAFLICFIHSTERTRVRFSKQCLSIGSISKAFHNEIQCLFSSESKAAPGRLMPKADPSRGAIVGNVQIKWECFRYTRQVSLSPLAGYTALNYKKRITKRVKTRGTESEILLLLTRSPSKRYHIQGIRFRTILISTQYSS